GESVGRLRFGCGGRHPRRHSGAAAHQDDSDKSAHEVVSLSRARRWPRRDVIPSVARNRCAAGGTIMSAAATRRPTTPIPPLPLRCAQRQGWDDIPKPDDTVMPLDGLAIDASHLARRYGRRWALVDVSFQLPRGRVMLVAGRNGAGKTTLLRILATAIRADSGRASVGGHELTEREEIRRTTALLAHQSYLYESLTARENLSLIASDTQSVLERVGLADRANDAVSTFSAGMRKRLSFARVLLQKPTIAFLDEPFGQLDPEGFELVEEVVAELKSTGATVVIATHQIDRITRFADAQLRLEN